MPRRRTALLLDVLPEHYSYKDDGCGVSSSCLNCPLPQCKYDDPVGYYQGLRQDRDSLVLDVWRREPRIGVPELARRFGLSQRTVYRILRRSNGNGHR